MNLPPRFRDPVGGRQEDLPLGLSRTDHDSREADVVDDDSVRQVVDVETQFPFEPVALDADHGRDRLAGGDDQVGVLAGRGLAVMQ